MQRDAADRCARQKMEALVATPVVDEQPVPRPAIPDNEIRGTWGEIGRVEAQRLRRSLLRVHEYQLTRCRGNKQSGCPRGDAEVVHRRGRWKGYRTTRVGGTDRDEFAGRSHQVDPVAVDGQRDFGFAVQLRDV